MIRLGARRDPFMYRKLVQRPEEAVDRQGLSVSMSLSYKSLPEDCTSTGLAVHDMRPSLIVLHRLRY